MPVGVVSERKKKKGRGRSRCSNRDDVKLGGVRDESAVLSNGFSSRLLRRSSSSEQPPSQRRDTEQALPC